MRCRPSICCRPPFIPLWAGEWGGGQDASVTNARTYCVVTYSYWGLGGVGREGTNDCYQSTLPPTYVQHSSNARRRFVGEGGDPHYRSFVRLACWPSSSSSVLSLCLPWGGGCSVGVTASREVTFSPRASLAAKRAEAKHRCMKNSSFPPLQQHHRSRVMMPPSPPLPPSHIFCSNRKRQSHPSFILRCDATGGKRDGDGGGRRRKREAKVSEVKT